MQFINIVVHSVEDMNFRVHLQYEFTKLGLDEYLDVSIAVHPAPMETWSIAHPQRYTSALTNARRSMRSDAVALGKGNPSK